MSQPPKRFYEFGPFRIDPENYQLLRDGQPVPLRPKAFDALLVLVRNSGRTVKKEELLRTAWTEPNVSERSLTQAILEVRKALGDCQNNEYVKTIPTRGYCLIAPVREVYDKRIALPCYCTSFIGRQPEMKEIRQHLSTTSLLTLTGPAGCGKTRLAVEVAGHLVEDYTDGVWLVGLDRITRPARVAQAVAAALGVREESDRPLSETLASYLAPRRALLVLDNCEHVIGACARLLDVLLKAGPRLRVLATSRQPLGIDEQIFKVPPLALPDRRRQPSLEELAQYEAVRLFVERALLAEPNFQLNARNAPAVLEVCRRLDGLPLALELAAAQVRYMEVEELARRLDRHLGLLGAGRRMAPSRHKTMRKAIDWSYNLLTKPERLLLRRLSVFWGGWTLEAAEAVCSGEGLDRREVVERLSRLIDQCLVLYEPARGSGRYRLPEPIRQYGLEKLSPRAEARLRDRHLDHFLALAEQAEPKLFTREQVAWVDPLEADHDNLLTALEWSRTAARGGERGLRLAGALTRFWIIRSYLTEGRQWLKETLERSGPASEPVMAKALTGAAALAYFQSDYSGAAPLLDEAIRRARQVGDPWLMAFSTSLRGYTAQFQGDAHRATALFQESLAIARKAGDTWNEAIALSGPALQAYFKGDYEESQAFNGKAVTLFRSVGERVAIIYPLLLLGHMSRRRGEYDRAGAYYQEGLAHAERVENKRCMEMCLYGLASVCLLEGQPARAARLLGAAEAVREAIHAPVPPMWRAEYDQIINETRAAMTQVAFAGAWAEGRAMTPEQLIAYALDDNEQSAVRYPNLRPTLT